MNSEGILSNFTTIIITTCIGAFVLLLLNLIIQLITGEKKVDEKTKNEKRSEQVEKKKDISKNKKKATEGRWTGRPDKQTCTHPWLLTSLKGHTSEILDMDFASNGKYLASCAEEEPDLGGKLQDGSTSSSNSDSSQENSLPSSGNSSPRTGLSRRQRKNRRRIDSSPEQKKKYRNRKADVALNRKRIVNTPLKQYIKIGNMSYVQLTSLMRTFFLSAEQMLIMGYPLEYSGYNNDVYMFKSPLTMPKSYKCTSKTPPRYSKINIDESKFDVNAKEFVPGMNYSQIKAEWNANHDSGQGSAGSSVSEENDSEESSTSIDYYSLSPDSDASNQEKASIPTNWYEIGEPHGCVRCGNNFFISHNGKYLTQERCVYHWGKLENVIATMGKHTKTCCYVWEYSCCHGKPYSRGCTTAKLHVWNGLSVGFNGPYDSYVKTRPRRILPQNGNVGIYALDCEMCYTVTGLELAKVTVIGVDGRLVYDSFVKPENEIVDYNTRFSGITDKDLSNKNGVKSLREVQNDLMGFINAETILIGHGLENDLRALRIVHYTVIDTAVVFAHPKGLPYRRALKTITSWILKRDIQCSSNGHNSYEDARACMELILWKIRRDFIKPFEPY